MLRSSQPAASSTDPSLTGAFRDNYDSLQDSDDSSTQAIGARRVKIQADEFWSGGNEDEDEDEDEPDYGTLRQGVRLGARLDDLDQDNDSSDMDELYGKKKLNQKIYPIGHKKCVCLKYKCGKCEMIKCCKLFKIQHMTIHRKYPSTLSNPDNKH